MAVSYVAKIYLVFTARFKPGRICLWPVPGAQIVERGNQAVEREF